MKRVVTSLALGLLAGAGAQEGAALPADVLGQGVVWRIFRQMTSPPISAPIVPESPKRDYEFGGGHIAGPTTAPPAADWMRTDFDDQEWAFTGDPASPATGGGDLGTASIQLRTTFGIGDAAKVRRLALALSYRGGVTVYVNGKEIGRKDMPSGAVDAATPALDYPVEAFTGPEAKQALQPPPPVLKDDDPNARYYKMRVRTAEFEIPAAALRAGMNVLAIQNSRAPYRHEALRGHWHGYVGRTIWAPVGVVSVALRAASADGLRTPKAPAVRVWNAGALTMVGSEVREPDPFATLKPLRLQAPRGGSASGQVVVSGDAPLAGLAAAYGDLSGPGGAKIPSSAMRVRFVQPGSGYPNPYDALTDRPAAGAALQPLWLTVEAPAAAKPGTYTGTLTLRGPTTTQVPVELTIYDWALPDARQWKTWAMFFQSPETLAAHYNVPLWSEAHFRLIEQSLILEGRLGQKMALVQGIGGGLLGQESMVLYRRAGGKVTPDLAAAERYLKLYKQHVGDPAAVCLYLWDTQVEARTPAETAVPVTFREGDKSVAGTLPRFGDPATEGVWDEAVAGVKRAMKELNWPESALMFGITQDQNTGKEATAFFAKHFPEVKWITYTHGTAPAAPLKLGIMMNPDQGGGHNSRQGWTTPRGYPNCTNQRDSLTSGSPVTTYRLSPFITLFCGFNGPGGYGLDYWAVAAARGKRSRFGGGGAWYRIIRGAVHGLLAPGPDGPVATVRYELLREGFQEAQALIYLETNAANPKLPTELTARAKAVRPRLERQMEAIVNRADVGWAAEVDNLYRAAAEVQAALGAAP